VDTQTSQQQLKHSFLFFVIIITKGTMDDEAFSSGVEVPFGYYANSMISVLIKIENAGITGFTQSKI